MKPESIRKALGEGRYHEKLKRLYVCGEAGASDQEARYLAALDCFEAFFGAGREAELYSAPGRTEVGGNHTDHQHGCVLAASVDLDVIAVASKNEEQVIRVKSEGFPEDVISLSDLSVHEEEKNKSASLIRGVAARLREKGFLVGGFDAYTTSRVFTGSGLSSSAAFEVLVGTILSGLYNGGALSPVFIAQAGQYAENVYFGKPSGLMDQAASSVGGFVAFDFEDPDAPRVEPVSYDFSKSGFALCVINTHASHADLTPDYAAIPEEMGAAAAFFGKKVLREVPEAEFYARLREVREAAGDRAVLRAMHFFAENRRAVEEAACLKEGRFQDFLKLVVDSGRSSFTHLQNIYSPAQPQAQAVSLTLALCERLLAPEGGAWRIQGGGFAGTVEAFVPDAFVEKFCGVLDDFLGGGSCHVLHIRPAGGISLTDYLEG